MRRERCLGVVDVDGMAESGWLVIEAAEVDALREADVAKAAEVVVPEEEEE